MSESSPKNNDSELEGTSGCRKSGVRVSSARTDWLIELCHSNLGTTLATAY